MASMRYLLGGVLALVGLSSEAMASNDSIANTFYPQSLAEAGAAGGSNLRAWSLVAVTLGSSSYLAVAYSNGISGVVRLLRLNGDAASLVSERSGLAGDTPRMEALDMDNDHVPELAASYRTGRRGERTQYLFRWTGAALSPLATDDAGRDAGFTNATFADVDGDGVTEVLEPQSSAGDDAATGTSSGGFDTYRFVNGALRLASDVTPVYAGVFRSSTGAPKSVRDEFESVPGDYVLRAILRDPAGNIVNSAEVKLNDVVVFARSQFKAATPVISAPVSLRAFNVLTVEVRSAPSSVLTIVALQRAPAP
jgi:hypothetical protein